MGHLVEEEEQTKARRGSVSAWSITLNFVLAIEFCCRNGNWHLRYYILLSLSSANDSFSLLHSIVRSLVRFRLGEFNRFQALIIQGIISNYSSLHLETRRRLL